MSYQEIFTALADPTRRQIFENLRDRPKTVGELAKGQTVSRPAVSQHLRVLQDAQLVNVEPQGNRRLYSIKREGLNELKDYLDCFWTDAFAAYRAEIAKVMEEKNKRKD